MTYLFSGNTQVTNEVEIKNDTGNPIPVTMSSSSSTISFAPTNLDAFGRLRISDPFTLFDSFHRFQDNGKITEYTAGTASSTHDANAGCIVMTVGSASGDRIYRESAKTFAYQPGKSLLILQTFCMAPAQANLRQRQGYFDTANGIFIEQAGASLYLVRRTSTSGTVQETRVAQNSWNQDTLTGTGASGYTLDITRTQIFWMDIEWLGVGTVRTGFVINGKFVHVHSFHHANILTLPYMTTACLPVRVELENTGATTGASYRVICTSVISEGGYELRGRSFNVSHPIASPYRLTNSNTLYPILSIRLKADRAGAIVLPRTHSLGVTNAANFRYHIITGATTSGGTWVSAGTNSSVEYKLNPTSYTEGTILTTAYIISSNQASSSPSAEEFPFKYQLERNTFTNTMHEFTIVIEGSGNNLDVFGHINWEEVT